jgi:hypothetical protein
MRALCAIVVIDAHPTTAPLTSYLNDAAGLVDRAIFPVTPPHVALSPPGVDIGSRIARLVALS